MQETTRWDKGTVGLGSTTADKYRLVLDAMKAAHGVQGGPPNDEDVERELARVLRKGQGDAHRTTAAALFGVAEDEVTSAQREVGRSANFGVLYRRESRELAERAQPRPPGSKNRRQRRAEQHEKRRGSRR